MNHTNFSIQNNNNQFMNLSGSGNLSNLTISLIKNTVEQEREGPSYALTIFSYIVLVVIGILLCVCFSLFCYTLSMECCESCCEKFTFIGLQNLLRGDESNNMRSNRINDEIISRYQNNETYEVSKNKLIKETPIDDLALPENIDSTDTSKLTCSICLEDINLQPKNKEKVVQLNCEHIYHQKCISKWCFGGITSVANCPLCRESMDHIVITIDEI